jgi:rhamnosyltransferase
MVETDMKMRQAPEEVTSDAVAVIVPTLNGGSVWLDCIDTLKAQSCSRDHVLVIDSGSKDGTREAALAAGFEVMPIDKASFDHGGTRQGAVERLTRAEILVFLTQDAVLARTNSLENLLKVFADPSIGMAYGRQLPRREAGPIEAHARLLNYPAVGGIRSYEDRARLGLKAAFCSNSFAAYRRSALLAVGGFPSRTIHAEDMIVAARMLRMGWKIAYAADAMVHHSHGYSTIEEFRRYFDTGVLHAREAWLLDDFGKPEGEGGRFIRSELIHLARRAPRLIPLAVVKTAAKYAGYRLGKLERHIPKRLKIRLSMHKGFWRQEP